MGLVMGLVVAALLAVPLSYLPGRAGTWTPLAVTLVLASVRGSKIGYVADLVAHREDSEARMALLDSALLSIEADGGTLATFWGAHPSLDPLSEDLRSRRFFLRQRRLHFVVRGLTESGAELEREQPWFLQYGDFDAL